MQTTVIRGVLILTALILAVPLVAMQFTPEVDWSASDFAIMGALLLGAGFIYELTTRKVRDNGRRLAIGTACAVGLLLIWAQLAVGII